MLKRFVVSASSIRSISRSAGYNRDDNLERWQRHISELAECIAIVFDTAKRNNGWPGASPAAVTLLGAPANVLKWSHP